MFPDAKSPVRRRQRTTTPAASDAEPRNTAHHNLRLHIQYVPTTDLKPPKRQLRKHSQRQLQLIQASIADYGFLNALLINADNEIVCGVARWVAAGELKLDQVPVIVVEHLTPEQLRVYRVLENRLGDLSEFDLAELKLEFTELEDLDCGLNLEGTGFSTSEIDDLVSGKDPEFRGDADLEVAGPAVTTLGDLWQLGDHRLLCGNSLEEASFEALMGNEKAGMVFGDPPYNVPAKAISGMGKHQHRDFAMAAGEMSPAQFTSFLKTNFALIKTFSVEGAIVYQCMDWKHMREMLAAGYEVFDELKNVVVWAKPSAGMGTFYRSQHEFVFVWKSGTAPHVNNFGLGDSGRYRSNVWSGYKGNSGFHRDRDDELAAHPTVKPWSLVADAIRDCSKRKAIILDPFGGFGTTMIAAERTGRKARLIELDPLYCDASLRRWEKVSGKTAILAAAGQTFAEVAASRGICIDHYAGDEDDGEFGETDSDAGNADGTDEEGA